MRKPAGREAVVAASDIGLIGAENSSDLISSVTASVNAVLEKISQNEPLTLTTRGPVLDQWLDIVALSIQRGLDAMEVCNVLGAIGYEKKGVDIGPARTRLAEIITGSQSPGSRFRGFMTKERTLKVPHTDITLFSIGSVLEGRLAKMDLTTIGLPSGFEPGFKSAILTLDGYGQAVDSVIYKLMEGLITSSNDAHELKNRYSSGRREGNKARDDYNQALSDSRRLLTDKSPTNGWEHLLSEEAEARQTEVYRARSRISKDGRQLAGILIQLDAWDSLNTAGLAADTEAAQALIGLVDIARTNNVAFFGLVQVWQLVLAEVYARAAKQRGVELLERIDDMKRALAGHLLPNRT